MQTVKVIGAGFSGLVAAYYLVKAGCKVQVVEKSARVGGLIRTLQTPNGPVETAANGIRNSVRLEAMCADIGVPLQATRREARARFIFRGRPKRFPLGTSDVLSWVSDLPRVPPACGPDRWKPFLIGDGAWSGKGPLISF